MAINSTLQFGCNEDFILYGAKTITCHQGTFKPYWNEDPPLCIRKLIYCIIKHVKN